MQKKWKRLTALALAAGMCFGNAVTTLAAQTPGWKQNATGWWYENADGGYVANDWSFINGKWYHFDASGYMQTGWLQAPDGLWYYLDRANGDMKIGWAQDVDGKWYYLNDNGAMATGWILDKDGRWYYTDQSGVMQTGWLKSADGKWYYMNQSGSMVTGWVKDSTGKYYYLNNSGAWDPNYDDSSSSSSSSSSSGSHTSSNIVTGNGYTYNKKTKVLTITKDIGTAESYVNINNLNSKIGTISKLVIEKGVDDVYITGTTVGDVEVLGGGSNSVHFRGLKVTGTMSVEKKQVHIVLEETTSVKQMTVIDNATIEVEKDAKIENADIQAPVTLSGDGNVGIVKVNTTNSSDEVTIDVKSAEITIAKEAKVVIKKFIQIVKVIAANVKITIDNATVGTITTDVTVNVAIVGNGKIEATDGKGEVVTTTAYSIQISDVQNGKVTTDPSESAEKGIQVFIKAEANEGYKVGEIKVVTADGKEVPVNTADNSFEMPAADATVTVTFVEEGTVVDKIYNIAKPTTVSNASITVDKTEAKVGDLVTVKVTLANGYVVDKATYTTANGTQNMTAKTANAEYTFTMPDEDVTAITVTVKEAPAPTPIPPDGGGDEEPTVIQPEINVYTVSGSGTSVVVSGSSVTVTGEQKVTDITELVDYTYTASTGNVSLAVQNLSGYSNIIVVKNEQKIDISNNQYNYNITITADDKTINIYYYN